MKDVVIGKNATDLMDFDDDEVLDDDGAAGMGQQFPWFRRPAPSARATLAAACIALVLTAVQYGRRVDAQRRKFGPDGFRGPLKFAAEVSAYGDNDDPRFSVARLATKSLFFLGFLRLDYGAGFLAMLGCLVAESLLEMARILVAYVSCGSLRNLRATSEDEARDISASTRLEPTNVYEDLTRPKAIAIMVFCVQFLLIGIVMYDSFTTSTRSCFDGTDGCPMLASLGSYLLYLMGTFMACVFYVGPLNSYGKKEVNPVFWLKLFLMSKSGGSVVSWNDPVTDQVRTMRLRRNDWRIWARFAMSFAVNSVCFHFLLHVLPVQIASKSSVMGVVFSSVGMIYLVDLDDTAGAAMTLVSDESEAVSREGGSNNGYGSTAGNDNEGGAAGDLEARKRKIVEDAVNDTRIKLEALAASSSAALAPSGRAAGGRDDNDGKDVGVLGGIAQALFLSAKKKRGEGEETSPESNRCRSGEGEGLSLIV